MKRTCATMLACVLMLNVAGRASAQTRRPALTPEEWKTYAERLPIGSTVRVTPTSGEPFTAILFVVNEDGIVVKLKTRMPERARRIGYDRLADLALQTPGVSIAKHAGVGALVGGAFFIWLLSAARR